MKKLFQFRIRTCLLMLSLCFVILPSIGCVERRLMIRSNPPGALVYIGKQEVGVTPVGVNFTYYGSREVTLVKDGYETMTEVVQIPRPWYQIFPLEFVTDNLIPARIRDYRTLQYELQPKYVVPTQEIIDRGNDLRNATNTGSGFIHQPVVPKPQRYVPPR